MPTHAQLGAKAHSAPPELPRGVDRAPILSEAIGMPTVAELTPEEATATAAGEVSRLMTLLAGASRTIDVADLRRVIDANHLFAAKADGEIVGLVCLVPMHLPQGVRLWVESVILDPKYRGTGLGRLLLNFVASAWARRHASMKCLRNRTDA